MRFISAVLIAVICWFTIVPVWAGEITLIQAQSNNVVDAGDTTVTVVMPGAVTQGNFIGCGVGYSSGDTVNITSVTDTLSNTYAVSATTQNPFFIVDVGIAHALNIVGGAAPTITLTLTGNAAGRGIICGEFKGVKRSGALDQATGQGQTDPGTGTDAVSSGNVVTTQHQELILGMSCCAAGPILVGTNFALVDADQTWDGTLEYRVVTVSGSYAATYTAAGATEDFGTRVATFRGCVEVMSMMGVGGC